MLSEFELQRERNILVNRELLAQLGIEKPAPVVKSSSKTVPSKKRKGEPIDDSLRRKSSRVKNIEERKRYDEEEFDDEDEDSEDDDEFLSGSGSDSDGEAKKTRKSKRRARARGGRRGSLTSFDGEITEGDAAGLKRRTVNGRSVQHLDRKRKRPDGRVFGPIKGIPVGKWWSTRLACSADGVHPPPVSGIFGAGATGAYSVAVSGGYEDDIDEGFRFTYTGSGGRDLKGTKNNPKNLRTAPQSSDQTLMGFNLALKTSCDTGKPVRVIRGFKAELGPAEGYRYDGLYTVMKAWEDTGLAGFKVWKFAFKRVDGQPPIDYKSGPLKEGGVDESGSGSDSESEVKAEAKAEVKTGVKAEINAKAETPDPSDVCSEGDLAASDGDEDIAVVHSAKKKQVKKQIKKQSKTKIAASEKASVEEVVGSARRSSRRRN